ncbi:hypothetical protein WDW37_01400 [Bdellovibrionota bacterium FG-1]
MKQQIVLAALALSITAFAPMSSHQCAEFSESVLEPLDAVSTFLNRSPSLDTLVQSGCLMIAQQFQSLPQGAELVRQLASQRIENTSSRCLYPINSIQYKCEGPQGETPRCTPQTYSYCGQWEYSMTNDSGYELSMELALRLDTIYEKAQTLCGLALRLNPGALEVARDLQNSLRDEILESSEKSYDRACGP